MLKKFADDEADERRKEENRRAFKERFKTEAAEQRLERAKIAQKEREREVREMKTLREQDEYKYRVIEEAKRRLLQRHADQLRGFLPRECK
jgi:putative cell wall-binding protein